ncbi:MAG: GHMP kinase [Verrucomicrobiae bacterium]|nr:GHMP kinase [Verrucomicrobiae bacterium]
MLITQTPLRVSLAGGPTDLPQYAEKRGGEVVGFAIDKYLYVWVKERFDRQIIVNWTKKEVVASISEIQHELVREAARLARLDDGFEVITTADIPSEGSGLGSSSALTVGLLNAFFLYRGVQVSTFELARMATRIEIDILGKPIGRQDQHLCALGGIQRLRFSAGGEVAACDLKIAPETLRLLNQNLLLFYTGATRRASDVLASHAEDFDSRVELYDQMKALVPRTCAALQAGRVDELGRILDEGWQIKKQLGRGVSLPAIDAMYDEARRGGALGGKVCGAGGGGFLLLYCPVEAQSALRARLSGYAEMPFQIEKDGTKAVFSVRRPMWKTLR